MIELVPRARTEGEEEKDEKHSQISEDSQSCVQKTYVW